MVPRTACVPGVGLWKLATLLQDSDRGSMSCKAQLSGSLRPMHSDGRSLWSSLIVAGSWLVFFQAGALAADPDWPQFLGPTRDGVYAGDALAAEWPKEGPTKVWFKPVGQGFSGPAVQDGKVI